MRTGFAWWFRKYSQDADLAKLETEARMKRLGLWADANPVAPWDWRAAQRGVKPPEQIVPNGVLIAALLPNPAGEDAGHEQVTIRNTTKADVDLTGWKLIDAAGNVYRLSGKVGVATEVTITMVSNSMPLNNDGDTITLVDPEGIGRHRVSYPGEQVRPGMVLQTAK